MLTYAEAVDRILETVRTLLEEEIELERLLNRFLARPVLAEFDLPRFDNSAVDGFGVLLRDVEGASTETPVQLSLASTIHAGQSGRESLDSGKTIKILTGAPVPASVEAVIMREFCTETNGTVLIKSDARHGENIRRKGDEFHQGDEVLPRGIKVNPAVVGLIASFGHSSYFAHRQPKVAIVVTGDELVKPGTSLKDGQIYESNSFALSAAVQDLGLIDCFTLHAPDEREATRQVFQEALQKADVVISAGGVSVGEHDFVKVVLEDDLQVQTVFWRVAVKPGKPVYFGYKDLPKGQNSPSSNEGETGRKLVFGLPGNPVSALVTFHLLVKPAIRKMQGAKSVREDPWQAKADGDIRKKAGRMDFVRGILRCSSDAVLNVSPTRGQDSHMLSGLAKADCLIHFPADDESITSGQIVNLERLDWHS